METGALYEIAFPSVFVFREKTKVPNGMGGFDEKYTDGEEFKGSLVMDTSAEARVAEKQGVTSLYTLTVPLDVPLDYGERFKDTESGTEYRITSRAGEKKTPAVASFQFQNFSVERVAT